MRKGGQTPCPRHDLSLLNVASTSQYAAVAPQMPALAGGESIAGPGECGAVAYDGALDFHSERSWTGEVLGGRVAKGGVCAFLMRLIGAHRRPAPPIEIPPWSLDFVDPAEVTDRVIAWGTSISPTAAARWCSPTEADCANGSWRSHRNASTRQVVRRSRTDADSASTSSRSHRHEPRDSEQARVLQDNGPLRPVGCGGYVLCGGIRLAHRRRAR